MSVLSTLLSLDMVIAMFRCVTRLTRMRLRIILFKSLISTLDKIFSRRQIDDTVFLFFSENRIWQFMQWRQFACNVKSCFLGRYKKKSQWRLFVWNVKPCFLGKIKKRSKWRHFEWNIKSCLLGKIRKMSHLSSSEIAKSMVKVNNTCVFDLNFALLLCHI